MSKDSQIKLFVPKGWDKVSGHLASEKHDLMWSETTMQFVPVYEQSIGKPASEFRYLIRKAEVGHKSRQVTQSDIEKHGDVLVGDAVYIETGDPVLPTSKERMSSSIPSGWTEVTVDQKAKAGDMMWDTVLDAYIGVEQKFIGRFADKFRCLIRRANATTSRLRPASVDAVKKYHSLVGLKFGDAVRGEEGEFVSQLTDEEIAKWVPEGYERINDSLALAPGDKMWDSSLDKFEDVTGIYQYLFPASMFRYAIRKKRPIHQHNEPLDQEVVNALSDHGYINPGQKAALSATQPLKKITPGFYALSPGLGQNVKEYDRVWDIEGQTFVHAMSYMVGKPVSDFVAVIRKFEYPSVPVPEASVETPELVRSVEGAVVTLDFTLSERGTRYGDFSDNAEISQMLKDTVAEGPGWNDMSAAHKEAITVILQKISRIVTGDPNYTDSWHDIQGYAKLAEERCETK